MKNKPQAENFLDGDAQGVLGLIWSMMLTFLKIDDADDLNFKDALLMWVQNKTTGYEGVTVEHWKSKDLKNGVALSAVIHKHRPQLIGEWSELDTSNAAQIAFDAAEKYFGLEPYLTPADLLKLDEISLVVYVSEYYYGVQEQRKMDLAAKRIGKAIKLTIENDALREKYNGSAQAFKDKVGEVEQVLSDRTVDNTMAGAEKRLEDFYSYKLNDKTQLISHKLKGEGIYNNLAMRLSHHNRPKYNPPAGLTIEDLDATMSHLESCELERGAALNAELNRQHKLVKLDGFHDDRFHKLKDWVAEKEGYLTTKEDIDSVSAAQLHLALLESYEVESKSVYNGPFQELKDLGNDLESEKYENLERVRARESEIEQDFVNLTGLADKKRPILQDDLAREQYKVETLLKNQQHVDSFNKIKSWVPAKEAYLNKKEDIDSVAEAQHQLADLDAYDKEQQAMMDTNIKHLRELGDAIKERKYETQYSSYVFETPEELDQRENDLDATWDNLSKLSAAKRLVLDDDLAREQFKVQVRLMNSQHKDSHDSLCGWVGEKETYLNKKETVESVPEAQLQLSLLDNYDSEFDQYKGSYVAQLKALGAEILAQEYKTEYSSWRWEDPEELAARENDIDAKFAALIPLASAKRDVLDEDLKREEEKEVNRLQFANLARDYERWTKHAAENASTHFGFTIHEVTAYKETLDAEEAGIAAELDTMDTECQKVFQEGLELGVRENNYTTHNLDSLAACRKQLEAALAERRAAYEKELEHQRALDQLCRDFAAVVDPFSQKITDTKNEISHPTGDLESQLSFVESKIASSDADGAAISDIKAAEEKVQAAGITYNEHTALSLKDVQVQFDQYKDFLEEKRKMLESEIEQDKLKGLTPEEMQDIEDQFRHFDKDDDDVLTKSELRGCLYSLGEEKSRKEIDQLMVDYGNGEEVDINGFKEFMFEMLGVSDTKDEILSGFKLINRGKDEADMELMGMVMNEHDLDYFTSTAPKTDDSYDYNSWTEDIFSR
eukprot:CAMPEP_0174260450 /NCGR_PEP_ID=MMETSP0439-20130205/9716_1 /TAXON_ID=0 /ORGANISM="Stereomyxa ramosa, Strain Chinc5" /LENGTH=1009 /DNA_ID=CAMNT_0015344697 /DNA_START=295 /DNA_END=3324 /DNA_ORIENTATION=+